MFTDQEFGLGTFEVAVMLLTHPERLTDCNDLWIDVPGNEYSPVAGGHFDNAPYFSFNDGKVKFNVNWTDNANTNYGSASAFLPKCLPVKSVFLFGAFQFSNFLDPTPGHPSDFLKFLLK